MISDSLNNSPIYHMFIYLSPKTVTKRLDKVRRTFSGMGRYKEKISSSKNGPEFVKASGKGVWASKMLKR
jgi:hypothetical protein